VMGLGLLLAPLVMRGAAAGGHPADGHAGAPVPSAVPEPEPAGGTEPRRALTAFDAVELVREHVVPALRGGVLPSSLPVEVRQADGEVAPPAPPTGAATVLTSPARGTPSGSETGASGAAVVHLNISRIEVLPPAPAPAPPARTPTGSRVDLDAYLARRDKEHR
ncbi:hypothetical protein AB0916_41850, partial [Streptomyces sp. NPDC005476]